MLRQFVSMYSSSNLYDEYCLINVIFLSGLIYKVLDNEMGDEVLTPPFSFVFGPAFTYLYIISHYCNASESNFKVNLGIQDSLIHQKASNLVNSFLL